MGALQVHQDKNLSQTVLKAMVVMEFLASTSKPSSAQEVADACNIPRPTVYRLLSTLASGGYVAIGPSGQYRLGTQVIVLSRQVLNNLDWPPIARPLLRELASEDPGNRAFWLARCRRDPLC